MEFLVFQRADSALLVVPALFEPPLACQRAGAAHAIGRCDIELDGFSPAVADAPAARGYASAVGDDLLTLRSRMSPTVAPYAARVACSDGAEP